jgi:transcriptional regulator
LVIEDPVRVRAVLEATVQTFEDGLPNPWSTERISEDYIAHMAKAIVAFEIPIARVEGKRKLGQNRSVADVHSAAERLQTQGDAQAAAIAELMLEASR